jgi:hypothetical protein
MSPIVLPGPARAPAAAALTVLGAAGLLFAVAFDQGQLAQAVQAAAGDSTVHEVFHDARHMLGFPCH